MGGIVIEKEVGEGLRAEATGFEGGIAWINIPGLLLSLTSTKNTSITVILSEATFQPTIAELSIGGLNTIPVSNLNSIHSQPHNN